MKYKILHNYIIIQFSQRLILGIFLPIMSLFQLEKGLTLLEIGITMGCYTISVVILEIPTGGLSDAIGRKLIYLISLLFFFLSSLIMIFAQSLILMCIGFAFFGAFRAMASGSVEALFVDGLHDIDPHIDLQKIYAIVNIYSPIGLTIGSILSGLIPFIGGRIFNQYFGLGIYSGNFIIMIIIIIFLFVFTVFRFQEKNPIYDKSEGILPGIKQFPQIFGQSYYHGIKNRIILLLLFSMLAWGAAFTGVEIYWQPMVKIIMAGNFQVWIISILASLYFLSGSAANLLITPLYKIFKQNDALLLSILRFLMGGCLFLLAFQTHLIYFIIFFVALNILASFTISPHKNLLNKNIPKQIRSTIISLESFSMEIGGLIGAFSMGILSQTYSIKISWIFGALIFLCSGFLFLDIRMHRR